MINLDSLRFYEMHDHHKVPVHICVVLKYMYEFICTKTTVPDINSISLKTKFELGEYALHFEGV